MALVKAEGLVVRAMNLGETSKLVTLFTRESGILKVIAKAVRSNKSRMGAALEPLTVARIVYYEKENRELQFLSQAELVEFFPNLPANLEKWGYANACAELVVRTQTSREATEKLYPILLNTLRALNAPASEGRVCFWAFQMKLVGVLGVAPNLRRCLQCSAISPTAEPGSRSVYHFDISRGGFLCGNCASGRSAHELSGETLHLLAELQTLPAEKFSSFKISPLARRETESFFRAYFAFHLEEIGKLTALKFVREVVGQATPSGMASPVQ